MTPVDYIRIDADILSLQVCDKAKMLLGLVKSFNHNGSCLKTRPRVAGKMAKLKETILKERAEKLSIRKIATKHDINEATLGDWLYFWRHRKKRMVEVYRSTYKKKNEKPARYKREWSAEALERRRECTETNNRKIKFLTIEDTEEEKKNIRFITKQV